MRIPTLRTVCRLHYFSFSSQTRRSHLWSTPNSKGTPIIPGTFFTEWPQRYNNNQAISFPNPRANDVQIGKFIRSIPPLDLEEAQEIAQEEHSAHQAITGSLDQFIDNFYSDENVNSLGGPQTTQHDSRLAMLIHRPKTPCNSSHYHRYFLKIVDSKNSWRVNNEMAAAYLLSMFGDLSRSSVPKTQVLKLNDGRFASLRRYFSGGDGRLLDGMPKKDLIQYLDPIGIKEIALLWIHVYVILGNADRFNNGNLILSGEHFNSQLKIGNNSFKNPLRHIDLEGCFGNEKWMQDLQETSWKTGDPICATLDWCHSMCNEVTEDAFIEKTIVGDPEIPRVNPLMKMLLILCDNDPNKIMKISFNKHDFQTIFDARLMIAKCLKAHQLASSDDIIQGKTNLQRQVDRLEKMLNKYHTLSFSQIISGEMP